VFHERVRRLACDHPIATNYFAWQVFARGYDTDGRRAVPPYLREERFATLRERAGRIETRPGSITAYLASQPDRSIDRYVLLDAQDWMGPAELTELWREIGRTARAGARAIFRTLAAASPLEGTLPPALLAGWRSDRARGTALLARDRTGVYGGFHLYEAA
jgi:S-adenosylmethionine-diacylglycerol 3-amino-3-carboxypropyl transferase